MAVSLIAAVAQNFVIGKGGKLPWRLPDDLARFKGLTMGHPVVMGRKTFDSLGRPLVGRRNIVLTKDAALSLPGCEVVRSFDDVMTLAAHEEIFVIGGASVYALFLPVAHRMYLTHVEGIFTGDSFFPEVRWEQWRVVKKQTGRSNLPNSPAHTFVDYERNSP